MALRAVTAEELQVAAAALRPAPATNARAVAPPAPAALLRAAGADDAAGATEDQEEPLPRITLRFMDGTDMEFAVNLEGLVYHLRADVASRLGLTDARVKLMFGTRMLNSNEVIGKAGIGEGAVVNAIIVPPLYQGSQVYNWVADAYASAIDDGHRRRHGDMVGEEVHTALQDIMARKAELNDAFAKLRLRKCN